jgi:hypothetical protein
LKYSPRPYEFIELGLNQFLPEGINLMLFAVKKLVFLILNRISDDNEVRWVFIYIKDF